MIVDVIYVMRKYITNKKNTQNGNHSLSEIIRSEGVLKVISSDKEKCILIKRDNLNHSKISLTSCGCIESRCHEECMRRNMYICNHQQ